MGVTEDVESECWGIRILERKLGIEGISEGKHKVTRRGIRVH